MKYLSHFGSCIFKMSVKPDLFGRTLAGISITINVLSLTEPNNIITEEQEFLKFVNYFSNN